MIQKDTTLIQKKKPAFQKRLFFTWTQIAALLCAPVGYGVLQYAFSHPQWVETVYIARLYAPVSQAISALFGLFPFSVAEWITVGAVLWVPALLFLAYRRVRCAGFGPLKGLAAAAIRALCVSSVLYFIYLALCGIQYARTPLSVLLGYDMNGMTTQELHLLCQTLADQANDLRDGLAEDENGVFILEEGLDAVLARTQGLYQASASSLPQLGGRYSTPKKVLLSPLWAHTQTTGMFFPYTVEANIDTVNAPMLFAATAAHEAAHQRGFMREDEANFLAWYVCSQSDEAAERYSGVMLALIHAGNALYRADAQAYVQVAQSYSEGVRRDLEANNRLWDQYEGKAAEISEQVNNTYLQTNKQSDGVASYGRMVDLIAAWYRQQGLFDR